jgi:hypothetical protein
MPDKWFPMAGGHASQCPCPPRLCRFAGNLGGHNFWRTFAMSAPFAGVLGGHGSSPTGTRLKGPCPPVGEAGHTSDLTIAINIVAFNSLTGAIPEAAIPPPRLASFPREKLLWWGGSVRRNGSTMRVVRVSLAARRRVSGVATCPLEYPPVKFWAGVVLEMGAVEPALARLVFAWSRSGAAEPVSVPDRTAWGAPR